MPYQNNAFFLECANSLPAGASPQTSLGILQRFHICLELNMTGIEIWFTVADPGGHSPSNGGLFFPRSILITDWQYDERNWLKSLNRYINSWTDLAYGGTLSPDLLSNFSLLQNCYFLNFNHWKYGFHVNAGKSMLLNEVVYLRCLLQIYAPTFFKSWLHQPKKLQRLGTASPKPQPNFILPSHPIITIDLSMNVNNRAHPSNHVICFKYLLQICTKMNGFQVWFFKKFLGRSTELLPQTPSPVFCSGFALSSSSALNSWALCTLYSVFALDYRALRSLDSGFTTHFQFAKLVWPPKYIPGSASAGLRPLWWISWSVTDN